MSTNPPFGAPLIGQTENALGAILDQQLAGTGLTRPQWIALTLTVTVDGGVERGQLTNRLASALKADESQAQGYITELAAAGVVVGLGDDPAMVAVTESGHRLYSRIRNGVSHVTQRLWGDLPAEDLATAARVLNTVLARANEELSYD